MYNLTDQQVHTVWYATLISATVSLFGSSFMLVTLFLFGKNKGLSRLIVFLAFGDWGWSLSVVVTHIILLTNPALYTMPVCLFMRMLFQFFGGSTVFWTTCISIYLYRCVFIGNSDSTKYVGEEAYKIQDRKLRYIFHAVSWGVPFIFCTILIFTREMEQDSRIRLCFPKPAPHFFMWFLPIMICFVVSVTVYIRLILRLRETMSWNFILKGFKDQTLPLPFRISAFLLVFFFCWCLDIIQYVIITYKYPDPEEDEPISHSIFILVVMYNVMLMSQGTLDVLMYGVANKEVRKSYTKRVGLCIAVIVFGPILVFACLFNPIRKCLRQRNERNNYERINSSKPSF